MATQRHLSNAPITEAVIDVRVQLEPKFDAARLLLTKQSLSGLYPRSEEQKSAKVALKAKQTLEATTTDLGLHGVLHKSLDGRELVQCRMDGFTFNRLSPYTSWEDILPKALSAWEEYSKATTPIGVTRVAVRFINHVPVTGSLRDAFNSVETHLKLPAGIPGALRTYGFRAVVEHPDGATNANIVQAVEPDVAKESYKVMLDIDVFRNRMSSTVTKDQLAAEFEDLRKIKNTIFFSMLTQETVDRLA